jgi:hypothetical protein
MGGEKAVPILTNFLTCRSFILRQSVAELLVNVFWSFHDF